MLSSHLEPMTGSQGFQEGIRRSSSPRVFPDERSEAQLGSCKGLREICLFLVGHVAPASCEVRPRRRDLDISFWDSVSCLLVLLMGRGTYRAEISSPLTQAPTPTNLRQPCGGAVPPAAW